MSLLKAGRPSSNKEKAFLELVKTKNHKPLNLNIDKDLHKKAKQFALDREITVTDLVTEALCEYMKK